MLMNDDNKAFSISYSAASSNELEHFKKKYSPNEPTAKIKEVRALDKRVDFTSTMLSIAIGMLGTALLISGVIQIITGFPASVSGIIRTVIGVVIIATVPFIHAKVQSTIKKYYGPKILALIEEIEQNQI